MDQSVEYICLSTDVNCFTYIELLISVLELYVIIFSELDDVYKHWCLHIPMRPQKAIIGLCEADGKPLFKCLATSLQYIRILHHYICCLAPVLLHVLLLLCFFFFFLRAFELVTLLFFGNSAFSGYLLDTEVTAIRSGLKMFLYQKILLRFIFLEVFRYF